MPFLSSRAGTMFDRSEIRSTREARLPASTMRPNIVPARILRGGQAGPAAGLVGQELSAGASIDAAGELGDDGFAVFGDDEGVALGELADFGAGEDGDVFAADRPAGPPGLPLHGAQP